MLTLIFAYIRAKYPNGKNDVGVYYFTVIMDVFILGIVCDLLNV